MIAIKRYSGVKKKQPRLLTVSSLGSSVDATNAYELKGMVRT